MKYDSNLQNVFHRNQILDISARIYKQVTGIFLKICKLILNLKAPLDIIKFKIFFYLKLWPLNSLNLPTVVHPHHLPMNDIPQAECQQELGGLGESTCNNSLCARSNMRLIMAKISSH